jgi:hypothetical protein
MINTSKQPAAGILSKTKGFILASLLTGAVAVPLLIPTPQARAENDNGEQHHPGLLGSWSGEATLDPASVPPGAILKFLVLDTFSAGGGFMESNSGPGAGQPDGNGNWVRVGRNQFATTQIRFGFNPDRTLANINKIRTHFTLNEQTGELTGKSDVDIFLPDGITMLPFHPVATYHYTRIGIEPVN